MNPADYILDISSVDVCAHAMTETCTANVGIAQLRNSSAEAETRQTVASLVDNYTRRSLIDVEAAMRNDEERDPVSPLEIEASRANSITVLLNPSDKPLWITVPLLFSRHYTNLYRQPTLFYTRLSQPLFYGLIIALFYSPLKHNQESVQDRIGLLHEISPMVFIGMLNFIAIFPYERDVFYRECTDGGYSAFAFFLTYVLLALPFNAAASAMVSSLVALATGLVHTGEGFGLIMLISWFYLSVGEFIGIAFCAVINHVGFSVNVMSMVISVFTLVRAAHLQVHRTHCVSVAADDRLPEFAHEPRASTTSPPSSGAHGC
jgi:hypothetical protein